MRIFISERDSRHGAGAPRKAQVRVLCSVSALREGDGRACSVPAALLATTVSTAIPAEQLPTAALLPAEQQPTYRLLRVDAAVIK